MYVQHFLKGIPAIAQDDVESIFEQGLLSRAIREDGGISWAVAQAALTEERLYGHVTDYTAFGQGTPFISLTAGVRTRQQGAGDWFDSRPAWQTATSFATSSFRQSGWIIHGWVLCLGVASYHVPGVAEDIRDTLIYPRFNRYWKQGEVCGKLGIPGIQIQRGTQLDRFGTPVGELDNPAWVAPEVFSNVREII